MNIERYNKYLPNKYHLDMSFLSKWKSKTYIRINTLKINPTALLQRLKAKGAKLSKVDFLQYGYAMCSRFSAASTPEYLMGYYYIQEASAQIPVSVLDPKPGEMVLDMCAAPGGKTTQIAQLMGNKGAVIALDNKIQRINALNNNIERMGAANCVVYHADAGNFFLNQLKFDKILLDAPCSGNFLSNKDWLKKRTIEDIRSRAKIQKELLRSAYDLLKPNGVLVYSTCSLEIEEDEEIVKYALDMGLQIQETDIKGLEKVKDRDFSNGLGKSLKIWPQIHGINPFFVARFQKE